MEAPDKVIQIHDDRDRRYDFKAKYSPGYGLAHISYEGGHVYTTTMWKMYEPGGDDDLAWEHYEEKLGEWIDEADTRLVDAGKDWLSYRFRSTFSVAHNEQGQPSADAPAKTLT